MSSRDRHGRGLRAPLLPASLPGRRTRRETFDDIVVGAADRLTARWGERLGSLEFAAEEVPPSAPTVWEAAAPLGRVFPAQPGLPARLVVYRRPLEDRATGRHDLAALVRDVLAEQVAHMLGKAPEEIDPEFGT